MGFQQFLDSGIGTVVGTTLHTIGAIAMLGSLVLFLSWAKNLRGGQNNVSTIQLAAVLGYLAILCNLAGGFMRTYQSAHPSIMHIGDNAWVQVLAVKHVILFAGMASLVVLFESTVPKLIRVWKKKKHLGEPSTSERIHVMIVALSIFAAAVLGAITQVTPIGDMDGMIDPVEPLDSAASSHSFSGQLTSALVAPAQATGQFAVKAGATSMEALLDWSPPAFGMRLALQAPDAERHVFELEGGRATASLDDVPSGLWTYILTSDAAIQVDWALDVLVKDDGFAAMSDVIEIPANGAFEINTEMEEGHSLAWHWTSDAALYFDLHSHFDGAVQEHVQETTDHHEGNFTNDRAGGYSLYWVNGSDAPVVLEYELEGRFSLHSIYGPAS